MVTKMLLPLSSALKKGKKRPNRKVSYSPKQIAKLFHVRQVLFKVFHWARQRQLARHRRFLIKFSILTVNCSKENRVHGALIVVQRHPYHAPIKGQRRVGWAPTEQRERRIHGSLLLIVQFLDGALRLHSILLITTIIHQEVARLVLNVWDQATVALIRGRVALCAGQCEWLQIEYVPLSKKWIIKKYGSSVTLARERSYLSKVE